MEQPVSAQEKIHFNANFVEAVLHSSIVSRTDVSGNITFVNRNFEIITGYTRDELIGKTHHVINSGIHPRTFWSDMWRTITGGNIWQGEICNRARNGSLFWLSAYIYPYRDASGELREFFSIYEDITQRKLQREALTKSELNMRAIVNSTNDIYFLLSPEGKLLNINRAGQKNLTEYWDPNAPDDYEGTLQKAFNAHPDSRNDFRRALNGETVEVEVELQRLDGEKIWHHVRHMPAYNDDNVIIGVSIVLTDIHKRKVQELRLRESETMYRAILNSTNDIYLFLSPKLKLLRVNHLGKKLLEQHWNAVSNEDIEARLRELQDRQPKARHAVEQALRGEIVSFETEIVRPDGTTVWYQIRYLPAYDDAQDVMGISIVLTNIHERKKQELLLQESKDHYRAILNSTSDVYFLVGPDRKLLAVNSTGDDSLARLVTTYNIPDKQTAFEKAFTLQERAAEYFERALAGEVIEVETEVRRYDGSKVWYNQRYLPVLNDAKQSIGVSISMTNIHTRKMQELEIEAKNQVLTKIAWSQSHEMRRPVASILGLMQLRQAEGPMITDDEFMVHLATMVNELDEFIKKNVERTYLASK